MSKLFSTNKVSISWNFNILYRPLSETIAELSSITAIEQLVYPCVVFINS